MSADIEPPCPGCGAPLAGSGATCAACGGPTTGVRYNVFVQGQRFRFPPRCACCLRETNRAEHQSDAASIKVTKCSGCSTTSSMTWLLRAFAWVPGFGIGFALASKFTEGGTPPYSIVLFGTWIGLIVLAYVITRYAGPFHRRGHTLRCRAVYVSGGGLFCHNKVFAGMLAVAPPAPAPYDAVLAEAQEIIRRAKGPNV